MRYHDSDKMLNYHIHTGSYDRKMVDSREPEPTRPSVSAFDCDDDKYRRRSLREWLIRWFRYVSETHEISSV